MKVPLLAQQWDSNTDVELDPKGGISSTRKRQKFEPIVPSGGLKPDVARGPLPGPLNPASSGPAALLRFRGESTHESVAVPKLDVVAVSELFGRFNGGGIVRVIVLKFGSNRIERPIGADDVGTINWHRAAPFGSGGSANTLSHR
jgi:hypothetical protein